MPRIECTLFGYGLSLLDRLGPKPDTKYLIQRVADNEFSVKFLDSSIDPESEVLGTLKKRLGDNFFYIKDASIIK
jgi:hypothetical protein